MRTNLLELLCKKNAISYIIFNKEFMVLNSNNNSVKTNSDIRDFLWEIVGLEETILKLSQGQKPLEIPMILKDKIYYDLEIDTFVEEDENKFIAYMQEKSKHTNKYAHIIKEINKKTLVYDLSDEKKQNNYYKEINKHLITFHVDLDGMITMVNDACLHFFNIEKDKMLKQHFTKFFKAQKSQLNTQANIFIAQNSMGEDIFFHADIVPITDSKEKVVENIIIVQDISHLKKIKRELEHAQEHDALTGLPNRHFFLKKIDTLIKQKKSFYICFINIDNFKGINEEYGAHAADMLLKHLTALLREYIDSQDLLMRLYGDNFAIIFEAQKNDEYIQRVINKLDTLTDNAPLHYNDEDIISFNYTSLTLNYPKNAESSQEFLILFEKQMQRKKIQKRDLKS
ncbi:diguanylate cyclase domain-containing protein [Sulfurimonas sp.]